MTAFKTFLNMLSSCCNSFGKLSPEEWGSNKGRCDIEGLKIYIYIYIYTRAKALGEPSAKLADVVRVRSSWCGLLSAKWINAPALSSYHPCQSTFFHLCLESPEPKSDVFLLWTRRIYTSFLSWAGKFSWFFLQYVFLIHQPPPTTQSPHVHPPLPPPTIQPPTHPSRGSKTDKFLAKHAGSRQAWKKTK